MIDELERALRDAPLDGEPQARERVRRTVLAAHSARPRRPRPRGAPLVWLALAALAGGLVLTQRHSGPARAVERLVRSAVDAPTPAPAPVAGPALPGGGRLLVAGGGALWVFEPDGRRHRIGRGTAGTWSPNGLFVAVAAGRTLAAVEPGDGSVRWRIALGAAVHDPRWAPDLTHIAYRAGSTLRIVYANGIHDVPAGGHAAAVAPAWRPHDPHTLAWAATDGTVTVEDADTGKVLTTIAGPPVRRLAWSPDGTQLLVAGRRHAALHDLRTGTADALPVRGEQVLAVAFGARLALATYDGERTQVRIGGRVAQSVPGRLAELTWSPDGRWLLAAWPQADQWLLLGHGDPRALTAVERRFGTGARVESWIR